MKKVIAILASSRKKHTYKYLEQVIEILLEYEIETEIIQLTNFNIDHCTGCQVCINKASQCYQTDDSNMILKKITSADGVILAFPVYLENVPGRFKSLIDKTAWWIHRPQIVGMPFLNVITTAGSGLGAVKKYINKVVVQWGGIPAGSITRTVSDKSIVEIAQLKRFISRVRDPKFNIQPSWYQIIMFQVQKALAMNILQQDRNFWINNGWDKVAYYQTGSVNKIKLLFGSLFYSFLRKKIKPA